MSDTLDDDPTFDDWQEQTAVRMNAALVAMPTEADLLAAIDHQDHDTRTVYADWLEENGDLERAEFVRLQDAIAQPIDSVPTGAFERCREIAQKTDMAWRVLVARLPILDCRRDSGCPRDWGSLAPTGQPEVRYCTTCERCVHYSANEFDIEPREPYVLDPVNGGLRRGSAKRMPPGDDGDQDRTRFDDSVPPWRR